MERETLKLFLDIRGTGNITRAANANYITQSAASKRIALLEKELGVTLFRRGKGRDMVTLTPAGEGFADIAERMLLLYQQAMDLKENAERKVLNIACINSVQGYTLPSFIMEIQARYPNLCVTLEDHHSAEIFPLLVNRRIDIGIAQTAAPFSELASELLFEEEYRVVMQPREIQLCAEGKIHPGQLAAEHEIFEAFDAEFQRWHDYWWQPSKSKIRVNTTPTAERYLRDAREWIIVPEMVAYAMEKKGFASWALAEQPPKHRVFITYNKSINHDMVPVFVREAKEYFPDYVSRQRREKDG